MAYFELPCDVRIKFLSKEAYLKKKHYYFNLIWNYAQISVWYNELWRHNTVNNVIFNIRTRIRIKNRSLPWAMAVSGAVRNWRVRPTRGVLGRARAGLGTYDWCTCPHQRGNTERAHVTPTGCAHSLQHTSTYMDSYYTPSISIGLHYAKRIRRNQTLQHLHQFYLLHNYALWKENFTYYTMLVRELLIFMFSFPTLASVLCIL